MALIAIPEFSLVLLIGPAGSGKSTFARKHFKPTEVLSSDFCRALVSDDENDQTASADAFAVLHFIAARRLSRVRLTVVDATNVRRKARQPLLALAWRYFCPAVAIVLDLPAWLCYERNRLRPGRVLGPEVIRRQAEHLRRSLPGLPDEGFYRIFVLSSPEEIETAVVRREPL